MKSGLFPRLLALSLMLSSEFALAAPPLTQAQLTQTGREGAAFARGEHDRKAANEEAFEEGGENGAGRVRVNGQNVDVNKLLPGANKSKADGLNDLSEDASNFDRLKAKTAAREAELPADDGAEGRAFRTAEQSAIRARQAQSSVESDNALWDRSVQAIGQGRSGQVPGAGSPTCTTTSRTETRPSRSWIEDEFTCERVRDFSAEPVCTREYTEEPGTVTYDQDKRALLSIDEGTSGQICRRERNVTSHRDTLSQSRAQELEITNEVAGLSCQRFRWAETAVVEVSRSKDAALAVNSEMGGLSCRRERWVDAVQNGQQGSRTANLPIDTQVSGLACTRQWWPTNSSGTVDEVQDGILNVNQEENNRFVCSRWRWPEQSGGTQAQSIEAAIDVHAETGGVSCTRWIQANNSTGDQPQSLDATLNVNNEQGGLSCQRYRWVNPYDHHLGNRDVTLAAQTTWQAEPVESQHNLAGYMPGGTTHITGFTRSLVDYEGCHDLAPGWSDTEPSAGNGWTSHYLIFKDNCQRGMQPSIRYTWRAWTQARAWEVRESGNCADPGTANCPTAWSCAAAAPTVINGISVSAAEVGNLAALYPGAPSSCTTGNLQRTCQGDTLSSNTISIAHLLPAGTTSISNFNYTVRNPQQGVVIGLVQTPAAGNNWVAIFHITRQFPSPTPVAPQITMTWNSQYPTSSPQVRELGNCTDAGTPTCPAQWQCTIHAPATVNSEWLTAQLAAARAPLYPGAANTCGQADLVRVCGGSGARQSQISIAHLLPSGTTTISDFAWTVTNPQANVTVTLVAAPSQANGWVATFSATRPSWAGTPANPVIRMTWNAATTSTTLSVRESGNCGDTGTPSCPANWQCTQDAPAVINGVNVTQDMARSQPLLFPGAWDVCIWAERRTQCSGQPTVDTTLSIAAKIPGGTTSISNFAFTVLNQNAGFSVALLSAPSQANGWIATFRTTRLNWGNVPQPQIRMTWGRSQTTTSWQLLESGNCNDPGSANCPTSWACTQNAPATVNGVSVTTSMAQGNALIYPGSPNTCLRAEFSRVCSGTASRSTNVSIADLIPNGVSAIQNFGFTVQNPQAGVNVVLLAAPTQANNWVASFRIDKTNYGGALAEPSVHLTWTYNTTSYNWSVRETGGSVVYNWGTKDFWAAATASIYGTGMGQAVASAVATNCSDPGSAVCPTRWSCAGSAPTVINGVNVTTDMVSGLAALYPGASNTCVNGELRRVCSGASTVGTSVSIADQIPQGATTIRNLAFSVLNPQPGVSVVMVVPPTYNNGWMAQFEVTRTDYSYQPAPANIRITFNVDANTIALSVRETGNCSDPGSTACPTRWSCTSSAPTTINGHSITQPMVENEPLLYPGAGRYCVAGDLRRVCDGSSTISTQVPIGDLLPEGTTEITNFQFSVTNPQASIAVSLLSPPTLQNGWVATFSVSRNYGMGGSPAKPNVMLRWNVLGPTQYDHSIITTGDCSGAADGAVSPSCSVRWRCLGGLPRQYGDTTLTRDMIRGRPDLRLYPEEDWDCADAVRERACTGEGTNLTVVDISQQLPAGVTELRNYGWEIVVPSPGVAVEQVEPPTLANGWRATFRTRRTDWSVTPVQPEVRLFWQVEATVTNGVIRDEGDCAQEGDEFCDAKWRCVEHFPATDPGEVMSPGSQDHIWYTPRYGTGNSIAVSIAGSIPAGTRSVQNFQMQVIQSSVHSRIMGVTQQPTAQNGWMVVIQDDGTCGTRENPVQICDDGYENHVQFNWENMSGAGSRQPTQPLYPGAPATCKRAEKYLDCTRINDGEVCHETEEGTVCEDVEGGPFDNCAQYRDDQLCRKEKTVCNEDGWGGTAQQPVCRIEVDVYKCRREVVGEDVVVRESRTCSGEFSACLDGSCTQVTESDEEISDSATMRKASAHLVMRENMIDDYTVVPRSGGGGPGGGGSDPGDPGGPVVISSIRKAAGAIADRVLGGVVSDARAQGFDPWKMPSGPQAPISDPDSFQGAVQPHNLRFFDGKSYNCMKALGGLLNCCTKNIDKANTGKEWWQEFGSHLREKWAQNESCKTEGKTEEENASGSEFMNGNATPDDLSKGFTGLLDRLKGGGTQPSCVSQQPRMEDVMKDFMGTMRQKYFPKLKWYCDTDEKELAAQKEVGACTYLGDYCRKKILGHCIDKRQRHCCFNSPMTKMIREKLRDMGIKGMGTAKNPDCSGVTPQQFASMNTGDMDTTDLEGRMLDGGMFGDLSAALGGGNLLDMWTGSGSNINSDRQNALTRTNNQLAGTDPGGTNSSIDGIIGGSMPTTPSTTTAAPGQISFASGFRTVSHSPTPTQLRKEMKVSVTRNGGQGAVSAVVTPVSGTAQQGVDFEFAPKTVSWGNGDKSAKDVTLVILRASRTGPVTFQLQLGSPSGGATIEPTSVMQIQINP